MNHLKLFTLFAVTSIFGCLNGQQSVVISKDPLRSNSANTYQASWITESNKTWVRLLWLPQTDAVGSTVTDYQIYRYSSASPCPASTVTGAAQIVNQGTRIQFLALQKTEAVITFDDLPENVETWIPELNTGFYQCYLVRALGPAGEDTENTTVFGVPPLAQIKIIPLSTPLQGNTSTILQWTLTSKTASAQDSFRIDYSLDGTTWTLIANVAAADGPLEAQIFSTSWTLPSASTSTARIRVTYITKEGAEIPITSPLFSIDTTGPVLALSLTDSSLRGGSTVTVNFSATDSLSTVASLKLQYAADGVTFGSDIVLNPLHTNYNWNIPSDNTTTAKLRLVASDAVGNSATNTSMTFSIDSTAPAAPNVSLFSAAVTNSASVALTVADCTDRVAVFVNEGAAPSPTDSGWQSCTTDPGVISYGITGEGIHSLKIWSKDAVGNVSTTAGTVAMTYDITAPSNPTAVVASSTVTNNTAVTLSVNDCTDIAQVFVNEGTKPSPSIEGWQNCTTTAAAISYTLPPTPEGTRTLKIWSKDAAGNVSTSAGSTTLTYDATPPSITQVMINNGNVFTGALLVSVAVSASDALSPFSVRVGEAAIGTGDCQSVYTNDSWIAHSGGTQTLSQLFSAGDGSKKACVWAKDAAGNVTTMTPTTGQAGINTDTIEFQTGNPPTVTSFSVNNGTAGANFGTTTYNVGDQVNLSWSVSDAEGLANHPVTISYTTNNTTWTDIITNYGDLADNTTSYNGAYTAFTAPGGYFRLKIVAKDQAGNTSIPVLSGTQNTLPWSVYAGTTDRGVGGGALSAILSSAGGVTPIAVHPQTNDVYAIDNEYGLIKMDSKTGLISKLIKNSSLNMPDDGILSDSSSFPTSGSSLHFDNNGYLYIGIFWSYSASNKIYQIDLTTNRSKRYLGGGTGIDGTATPLTASVYASTFTFDEDNTLYYFANCTPGIWDGTSTLRLMKVTQTEQKTAGVVSVVAGNCVRAAAPTPGPADAPTSPLTNSSFPFISSITVWNHGASIYFGINGSGVRKILNGQIYGTTISPNGYNLTYNPVRNKLYVAGQYSPFSGSVFEYVPNLTGANGETFTSYVSGVGSGNCTTDGIAADQSCVMVDNSFALSSQGMVFFVDGPGVNSPRPYRVRYKDTDGKIRTILGSLPFFGENMKKNLVRSSFSGIHYKQATDPNVASFPAGLYFLDSQALTFGYIDPVLETAKTLFGNQQGNNYTAPTGTTMSPNVSLGAGYAGGNMKPLTFDTNGLPWFRFNHMPGSIDANQQLVVHGSSSTNMWELAAEGADPYLNYLFPYGGYQNLTLKNKGIFLIGGYRDTGGYTNTPIRIRYFDYDTRTILNVMGSSTVGVSTDNAVAGSVQSLTLSLSCANTGPCFTVYRADEDRLYFSEENKIRYITQPTTPAASTLVTLFSATAGQTITNFTFRPDYSQVFYLKSGKLFCHDISSGKAWCNDTDLGPSPGMGTIGSGPNQFTWKDTNTLLVSTYGGYVYQYALLP